MEKNDKLGIFGRLVATLECSPEEFAKAKINGVDFLEYDKEKGRAVFSRKNTFVNTGLQMTLDRLFGIGGPPAAPTGIAVSADDQSISGSTTLLDPAGGDTGFTRAAFASTPTRSSQTVTCSATFTQATVSFAINKVGILNTTTDAGTGLLNVIGGTSNSPFTIDLTGVTTWTLTMEIQITASAT